MVRFPSKVYGQGTEPDARFSLANQRTYLAWIRTSLALLAGGVALGALGLDMQPHLRLAASLLLILTGILVSLQAWKSWTRTEQALRSNTPLPTTTGLLPFSIIVASIGVLVLLAVVLA